MMKGRCRSLAKFSKLLVDLFEAKTSWYLKLKVGKKKLIVFL